MASTKMIAMLLGIAAIVMGCANPDRTISQADQGTLAELAEFERLHPAHKLDLAAEEEPGRSLVILGRLVRAESGLPIPDQEIQVYHANHEGEYDETVPGDESTARLNGVVRTNSDGRFIVSTVLPGDYGASSGNRHIHVNVTGAKPEGYDFYFMQFINRGLLSWARGSAQAVLLDLKEGPRGTLIAVADLPVKRYQGDSSP